MQSILSLFMQQNQLKMIWKRKKKNKTKKNQFLAVTFLLGKTHRFVNCSSVWIRALCLTGFQQLQLHFTALLGTAWTGILPQIDIDSWIHPSHYPVIHPPMHRPGWIPWTNQTVVGRRKWTQKTKEAWAIRVKIKSENEVRRKRLNQ